MISKEGAGDIKLLGVFMFNFFLKGGPVMWPLLITSVITLTVVVERFLFLLHERPLGNPKSLRRFLLK